MPQHQIGASVAPGYVDRRRSAAAIANGSSRGSIVASSAAAFTANAVGTTTTIVGANAAPGTNDNNVIRRGEFVKVYTGAGVPKDDVVREVTGVAVAASTTVTFAPALAANTASGDVLRRVGIGNADSIEGLDDLLLALAPGTYTQAILDRLTLNDKQYAVRALADPLSI
jgi:hypothetical protein